MSLSFETIDLSKQAEYLSFWEACPVKASDYSLVNLWSWADAYGLVWAWTPDLVWIKQTLPGEVFWAPVGAWNQIDWESHLGRGGSFTRVPEMLARMWQKVLGSRVSAQPARGHWDYLYSAAELRTLKGNRYHKKKNLINQFLKKYAFEYVSLTEERIELAAGMQESWCTWRDCESNQALDAENAAIMKVLANWRELEKIVGGALMVEGNMVAYTVAEALSADTLLIHFEKGDPEYKGVYQAINQMFLDRAGENFQLVNREQDLGDEGLRKAKLSYHPVDFLKKETVEIV